MSAHVADTHPRVLAILLGSLNDYTPAPKSSLRPQRSAFAPSAWQDCPSCDDGRVKRGKHTATCTQCKGAAGWKYDPYDQTRKPIETSAAELYEPENLRRMTVGQRAELARSAARELMDKSLAELERSIARAAVYERGDSDVLLDALERQVRFRTGQRWYRQITEALQGMRAVAPFHYQALVLVDVLALESAASLPRPEMYEEALAVLAEVLPASFRAPRDAVERASRELEAEKARLRYGKTPRAKVTRQVRDANVLEWHGEGHPVGEIARRVGLSERRVWQIIEQHERRAA